MAATIPAFTDKYASSLACLRRPAGKVLSLNLSLNHLPDLIYGPDMTILIPHYP